MIESKLNLSAMMFLKTLNHSAIPTVNKSKVMMAYLAMSHSMVNENVNENPVMYVQCSVIHNLPSIASTCERTR